MTTAPFPLNSVLLVAIALGVSNVILRAYDHGNAPDWLLCTLTVGGLADFISSLVAQQTLLDLTFVHHSNGDSTGLMPFFLSLAYLTSMLYLSYLSAAAESKDKSSNAKASNAVNLAPLRKQLEQMQQRFFPEASSKNGSSKKK